MLPRLNAGFRVSLVVSYEKGWVFSQAFYVHFLGRKLCCRDVAVFRSRLYRVHIFDSGYDL